MPRRAAAALVASLAVGTVTVTGCKEAPRTAATALPTAELHLVPTTDLAQAASITWLVDVRPRPLLAVPELLPAIYTLLPGERVRAFADRSGLDPFLLEEITCASYASAEGDTTLYLVSGPLDPGRLEAVFRALTGGTEGRGIDRHADPEIVRTWGTLRQGRAQMATFGHAAAGLEIGRFGPLRSAELFAEGRLRRASPALRVGALAQVAALLRAPSEEADSPLRAFALGPFEGASGKGLGGLLAASTAVAIGAKPALVHGAAALRITLVLTGGWGSDAPAAADKLAAAFDALSATALGRLSGLDHPLDLVHVDSSADALRLTVALDALALARGARAEMGAEVIEIMSY